MITKGRDLEQVKQIYDSSDKKFITEESNNSAINGENMVNYLYYDNENSKEVLGYITVYESNDFIQKEEFDVFLENIKSNSVYIWEIGTRKSYEGRGIATQLLSFVKQKYNKNDIYSCIDVENIASIKIHEKLGFKNIKEFTGNFFSEKEEYIIFKLSR